MDALEIEPMDGEAELFLSNIPELSQRKSMIAQPGLER